MTVKGKLTERFAVVNADSIEGLAAKLNTMASDFWFKVVHVSGTTALLDMAIELMTPVDQDLIYEDVMDDDNDSVIQGHENTFKQNLIA